MQHPIMLFALFIKHLVLGWVTTHIIPQRGESLICMTPYSSPTPPRFLLSHLCLWLHYVYCCSLSVLCSWFASVPSFWCWSLCLSASFAFLASLPFLQRTSPVCWKDSLYFLPNFWNCVVHWKLRQTCWDNLIMLTRNQSFLIPSQIQFKCWINCQCRKTRRAGSKIKPKCKELN